MNTINYNKTEIESKIFDLLVDGHDIWQSNNGLSYISKHGSTLILRIKTEIESSLYTYYLLTEKETTKTPETMTTRTRNNLKQIISANYKFWYMNEYISSREGLKELIKNGLEVKDIYFCFCDSSNSLFDTNTTDYIEACDKTWIKKVSPPRLIVFSNFENEYVHIEDTTYAWIDADTQDYVQSEEVYYYNSSYYISDALNEHGLVEYDGRIFDEDDMVYCEDIEENRPSRYAYHCEHDDCYYADSDNANKRGLKGYHKSKIDNKAENAKIKIGFEVEKEDSNFSDYTNIRAIGWDAERDGSLNNNGFELVSAIYNLEDLTQLKEDTKQINDFLKADYSRNCGGHINVSIEDKSNREVFNLIRGFIPLIYAMYYGRLDNRYATAKKVNDINQYNRYDAFNMTKNNGILEFRIFSAVRTREQLIWRAEFIALLFKHHRKGSASVLKMLFTDSPIKKHLLKIYEIGRYNTLVDRVIKYTDIYMTARDSQQTAKIITDYKNKVQTLTEAQNIIAEAVEYGRDMPILESEDNA